MKNDSSITFDAKRLSQYAFLFSFIVALLYVGRTIFIPLAFAFFFSMMLFPIVNFLELHKVPRIISILITFLGVLLILAGMGYFFGTQFFNLFQNIRDFGNNIQKLIDQLIRFIDENILTGNYSIGDFYNPEPGDLLGSTRIIEKTLSSSTYFMTTLLLTMVYTFLFLLYRTGFKEFILYHFRGEKRDRAEEMVTKIQKVAQNYFFGIILIIIILGTLNGTGLWIIGLDYPFLFGFFAALLAIIPYIGTFIGGLLPTLYALINYDSIWTAVAVVGLYVSVQAVEGNILTPKIVGSRVSLNPLIALVSLFIGGLIWGIAGMILFIPIIGILKVIFDSIDTFKPYGLLLSSHFGSNRNEVPIFRELSDRIREDEESG